MEEKIVSEQVQSPSKEKVYHFIRQGTVILYRINTKTKYGDLEIAVEMNYNVPVDKPIVYLLTIPFLYYTKDRTDPHDEVTDYKSIFQLGEKVQIEKIIQDSPSTCFARPLGNKPRESWPDCELGPYFVQTCEIPESSIITLTKSDPSVSIKSVGNNYLIKK